MASEVDLLEGTTHLPAVDRAELARQLLVSFVTADSPLDSTWRAEIERRLAAAERGEVSLLDWRESVQRARSVLAERGGQ
jgi:putative addiction module component (TIGR02574 family)